jgi:N-sulfoglucosamine sulfohydrolase
MPFPGAKASSFDSGHHCPLIIRNPAQQKRGIRSQALMNWVDFCPTILEWCDTDHPDGSAALYGKSILPILEDESDCPGAGEWEETFFSHCFHEVTNYYPYRVLRGRRYKYVRNLAYQLTTPLPSDLFRSISWTAIRQDPNIDMLGQRSEEGFLHQDREALFDIQNDPAESTNLISDPQLTDVIDDMRKKVITFRQKTEDPWLEQSFQEGELNA